MSKINSIYHYCSIETMYSIISNKTIRLSDLNKTNDYMEKRWTLNLIERSLVEAFKENEIKIDLYEKYFYEDGINSHIAYIKSFIEEYICDSSPILISCFSRNKDKLSQWRAYGQDGYGVSIGVDLNKIEKLQTRKSEIIVEDVCYDENEQIETIKLDILEAIIYMKNMFENDSVRVSDDFNEYFREEFDAFCEVVIPLIDISSTYIKNPAFIEEDEIRIIYNPNLFEEINYKDEEEYNRFFKNIHKVNLFEVYPLKFDSKNNQIIGYTDISFKKLIKDLIINEIVIGPKSKLTSNDLYFLLVANGYNANEICISNSTASYR